MIEGLVVTFERHQPPDHEISFTNTLLGDVY